MVTKPILPQAFWFRISVPCLHVDDMPGSGPSGRLLELPESCALPGLQQIGGPASWAEVRVGWNALGLGIVVLADGVSEQQMSPRPEGFAIAHFWIDTRDTRTVSRATRFCHHFVARLEPRKTRGQLGVKVGMRSIARAVAEPPPCPPDLIASRAQVSRSGWTLEVFLPAQAFNGFDPETNRRLGFAYQITDFVRDDQFLGVGRDFPVAENPSLWATLELHD
jgi:hypothetical protein